MIQTIVERIYIVEKDNERYCHIFIKGCSGEDYTGFFQTAGYIEQKTTLCVIQNSIAFTPKYRRKMIYNQLKMDIRDILKQLCSYKGVEIIEGHIMPDHIHMLVSIPPKMSVSSFMGYLKGKSALMIFDRHANLKYKFGNRHFWSEGYYVSTVGLNEATIKKYIQDQENYDIMQDKLSVKEYEDPFKGTESK